MQHNAEPAPVRGRGRGRGSARGGGVRGRGGRGGRGGKGKVQRSGQNHAQVNVKIFLIIQIVYFDFRSGF